MSYYKKARSIVTSQWYTNTYQILQTDQYFYQSGNASTSVAAQYVFLSPLSAVNLNSFLNTVIGAATPQAQNNVFMKRCIQTNYYTNTYAYPVYMEITKFKVRKTIPASLTLTGLINSGGPPIGLPYVSVITGTQLQQYLIVKSRKLRKLMPSVTKKVTTGKNNFSLGVNYAADSTNLLFAKGMPLTFIRFWGCPMYYPDNTTSFKSSILAPFRVITHSWWYYSYKYQADVGWSSSVNSVWPSSTTLTPSNNVRVPTQWVSGYPGDAVNVAGGGGMGLTNVGTATI